MADFDEAAKGLKLYVGGLSVETTDDDLKQYFGKYGEITEHVVMKLNARSRNPTKCGFVTFAEPESVDEVLNDQPHNLGDVNVETMRAKPKGTPKKTFREREDASEEEAAKGLKLFIGGLNYQTTDDDLKQYFGKYGEITDHIVMKLNGRPRGFGFVTFAEPESVDEVLNNQPHNLGNRNVETIRAKPRGLSAPTKTSGEREDTNEEERNHASTKGLKIFIGGLDYSTTDDEMYAYFEKYGEITDHVVMKEGGMSKGFGYVTFAETSSVDQVLNDRPHRIGERDVDTKRAVPKSQSGGSSNNSNKLFIGGLKEEVSEEDLMQVFGIFGVVKNLSLPLDKDKRQRGFAFIEFSDWDTTEKVARLGEVMVKGKKANISRAVNRNAIHAQARNQGRGGGNNSWGRQNYGGPNMGGNNWGRNQGNNPSPQEMFQMFGEFVSQMQGNMGGYEGGWDGNQGGNWMGGSGRGRSSWGNGSGPMRNSNRGFRGNRKPYGGRR